MPDDVKYPDQYPYPEKTKAKNVEEALRRVQELERKKVREKAEAIEKEKKHPPKREKIAEIKEDKEKPKRKNKLLKFYNSSQLIPVGRSQIIPGNYYIFKYNNWKHVPTPLVLYIGTNAKYGTMEGISMQYLAPSERFWVEVQLGKMGLHSERAQSRSKKIKNLLNEEVHLYRNTYTSNSIYNFLRRKMKNDIYFYRRYKFRYIPGRIYLVPIEKVKEVLSISTPLTSAPKKKIDESKKKAFSIFNMSGKK